MRKPTLACLSALLALSGTAGPAAAPDPTYAFTNGRWWDGSNYVRETVYSTGGTLRRARPKRVDETINFEGRFVVPPLAEGHNHWLEPTKIDQYNACYLADGVFYVRDMANTPWVLDQIRDKVNLPTSVDFVTALQGFSAPGAHPVEILDYFVKAGIFPSSWKPDYDPEGGFVVQTEADIDKRFQTLLSENPSYVKAFLSYSEEFQKRRTDPSKYGNHRGMDPALLPHLVKLTHKAGLRAFVHIYTAADFRTAIAAGADEIAHLPGAAPELDYPAERYRLTAADAELARQRGVRVATTIHDVIGLEGEGGEEQAAWRKRRDEVIIPNLKLLRAHRVPIMVGSDHFRHSPLQELLALKSLGIFTARELMRMDTIDTARDIFPGRRIGALSDGYEANFLVLDKDPMADIANLRSIWMRVKQGRRLSLPEKALHRPSLDCIGDE